MGGVPTVREHDQDWLRRVHDAVRAIPPGRVASYGLVALVAGRPRAARAVGNRMLHCGDPSVPCHRVVHADGRPGFAGQRARLVREGVRFRGERVDVARFLWAPRLPRERTASFSSSTSFTPTRRMRKVSPAR